jgi:hypothetical protein
VCTEGAKRCAGDTPQACDAEGQWQDSPPCNTLEEECRGGACVEVCTPRDLRCKPENNFPEICDETGVWRQDGVKVCDACKGCDTSTGLCSESTKPDGTSCDDGSKCTLVATCRTGVCMRSIQVACVAAVPCSRDTCNPDTGTCAVMDGELCEEDGNVCTVASSCQTGICNPGGDHVWAHWPLNPPRAQSPERYVSIDYGGDDQHHGIEVVFDKVTNLMWERTMRDAPLLTWDEANEFCQGLNRPENPRRIPGYPSGWRLPTRIELASIVDYSQPDGYVIDTTAFRMIMPFPEIRGMTFWTSSTGRDPNIDPPVDQAWDVDFNTGYVLLERKSEHLNVRCVR